ncbi:MAG: hypothetical protein IT282_08495 [Bacteroidetes bacterium]|nr:hypothetical protein [Bacteroidota bacterium]
MNDERAVEMQVQLRKELVRLVSVSVSEQTIDFLRQDGSVRQLNERGRLEAFKYCLFHPDSPVRKSNLRQALIELLRQGEQDAVIYRNARLLLALLVRIRREGLDMITREEVADMLLDEELVRQLWITATSREIQYRMQYSMLEIRQFLIQNGISEEWLPMTKELRTRLETRSNTLPT